MLDPAKPVDNLVKSEFSGVIQISLTSAACTVEIKNKKILCIGDNLNTDIKGANNLNKDCLFISDGVHRDEFNNNSELENLLRKYKVKANFFQKELEW